MIREFRSAHSRRDFLKRSSALAALGITTSLTPDLAFGQAKTDLNGVEIDYWNMIGVQNKIVRQISEDIVTAFQQKHRLQGQRDLERLRRHHRPEIPHQLHRAGSSRR